MTTQIPHRVLTANASGDLGSLGKGEYVLIRQINFPDTYTSNNHYRGSDHDRLYMWDHSHTRRAFTEHLGTGEMALGEWAKNASQTKVLAFCVDVLKAEPTIKWTGCRILGTVNRSSGYVVWTIEVFAKHPNSRVKVYSGFDAPNVKTTTGIHMNGTYTVCYGF